LKGVYDIAADYIMHANMSGLHGKSVLLGIGIGTILTALLGLIFFLGYKPEMDEAKVKELARKYGMVEAGEQAGFLKIEITKGETISEITEKLAKTGLIKDSVSFQIKIVNRNLKDEIKPGIYEFRGNENEDEIIAIITGKAGNY